MPALTRSAPLQGASGVAVLEKAEDGSRDNIPLSEVRPQPAAARPAHLRTPLLRAFCPLETARHGLPGCEAFSIPCLL